MEKKKILYVDDDPEIREALRLLFHSEGYDTIEASNAEEVLYLMDNSVDLVVLDVMMPGMNGYTLCSEIRKHSFVPILFLSARGQDSDKTMGFSCGGDDYLVKPFSYSELVNRVKSLLRRCYVYNNQDGIKARQIHCCENLVIDPDQYTVLQDGREIPLTDIEFRILYLLASHPGQFFSTQRIYESVWQESFVYSVSNLVMVHIRNVRRKLGDGSRHYHTIRTAWGKGYYVE